MAGNIIGGRTRRQKEKDDKFLKQVKKIQKKKPIKIKQGFSPSFEAFKKKEKGKEKIKSTSEKMEEVKRLLADGKSKTEASKIVNLSLTTIRTWLKNK